MEKLITYIADDGREFDNEADCRLYEMASSVDFDAVQFFNPDLQDGIKDDYGLEYNAKEVANRYGLDFDEFVSRAGSIYVKDAAKAKQTLDALDRAIGFCYPNEIKDNTVYAYDENRNEYINLDALVYRLSALSSAIRAAAVGDAVS